jgi:hypothetical protein
MNIPTGRDNYDTWAKPKQKDTHRHGDGWHNSSNDVVSFLLVY